MANRSADWLRQARADLNHARNSLAAGDHEWACFASQQAAEKALKAVYLHHGLEAWGHTVSVLLGNLSERVQIDTGILDRAKALDKHYIPTRYPNGFDSGAPTDFYTPREAEEAIDAAESIIKLCADLIGRS